MPWTPEQREISGRVAEFMETIRGKAWASVHGCVRDVIGRYVRGINWIGTPKGEVALRLAESVVTGTDILHKDNVLTAEQWDQMVADIEKCPAHEPKKRPLNITKLTPEQQEKAIRNNIEV